DVAPEPPVLSPRTLVATFPKLGQAKLQLGFPSVRLDSPHLYALDLLSTILGGGESSILVEELRDKRRLVNAVQAGNPTPDFVDGTFQIEMDLPPEKIAAASEATLEILDKVIKEGVDGRRLKRAKVQMRAARVKGLQTSESVAAALATDFMNTGDPHFADRYVQRIELVTAEEVQNVAKIYFNRNALLTTALLPAEYVGAGGLPRAEDLLRPVAPTTKETQQPAIAKVTRIEMPNGTILLHKRLATSPLVVVKMFALGGVTSEDEKTNGLGNLTMEMLPRGTKTRSAQQIAEFFDSIGGELETSCGNNSWSWGATCLKGDFEKAFDVFVDVVNNPSFPEAEVGPMKERVAAHIEGQDADWSQQAMRFFKKSFFGPQHSPYQFLPIGTKENVGTFTRAQMGEWYADQVMQGRRVVAIYGDVELDKAKAVALGRLGSTGDTIKPASALPPTTASVSDAPSTARVNIERVEFQKTEQPLAGVVIGYDARGVIGETATYPLVVADTMSSGFGYPTGYLHEILRGRGLVYMVHAVNSPGRDPSLPGTFYVIAGCDPSKVDEVIDVILENIARLQGTEQDMQPGWFERAKQLITTTDALDNETPAEQAQTAAIDEMIGVGYDYHDKLAPGIKAVTLDAVRDVAKGRLDRAVVTVSTPAPEAVKVKTGTRTYEQFPPVDLTPRGVQHDAK
ncbi:MAG: insulinase family protein, partial [Tepidisphaeraceae bacterium]